MAVLLIVAIIVLAGIVVGAATARPRAARPRADRASPVSLTPTELAADDPVAALLRYGTPEDAAQLAEQGVDLSALGYRAPDA